MKRILYLLIGCLALSMCFVKSDQADRHSEAADSDFKDIPDADSPEGEENEAFQPNLVLTENSIAGIPLPFPVKEMLDEISEAFEDFQVTKEVGQQDGPDFPVYMVKDQQETVLFFAMNWVDTFKLDAVYIESPVIIDQYGLTVGQSLDNISKHRTTDLKTQKDYHNHTYVLIEGSRIIYEVDTDESLPDTTDIEEVIITNNENGRWTIAKIIWR